MVIIKPIEEQRNQKVFDFFSLNRKYLIRRMATVFDNMSFIEREKTKKKISSPSFFFLSCSAVERTNRSERKKKSMRDSRERQRERARQ